MILLWIALNVINIAASGFAASVCYRRYREAARVAAIKHKSPASDLLNRRNARYMRSLFRKSLELMILGGGLIAVALRWVGPVPWFVPAGTGLFALIWADWARELYEDWKEVRWIAALTAEEIDRAGRDSAPVVLSSRRRYNAPSGS